MELRMMTSEGTTTWPPRMVMDGLSWPETWKSNRFAWNLITKSHIHTADIRHPDVGYQQSRCWVLGTGNFRKEAKSLGRQWNLIMRQFLRCQCMQAYFPRRRLYLNYWTVDCSPSWQTVCLGSGRLEFPPPCSSRQHDCSNLYGRGNSEINKNTRLPFSWIPSGSGKAFNKS